ncbi:MAG: Holliday junction branch migration protein RuvA [Clostridia bacterium]|nr:Holliday junction branch migration protein RuvA [Clostridia bacterium]
MFYSLKGRLALCEESLAVIECGGVGYQLTVSTTTVNAIGGKSGNEVLLYTHLQVREDGLELYGFETKAELSAFRLLIGISGVGPKAAMAILSLYTPDKFAYFVATEDAKALAKASGIGQKTAARIVLELKDKISKKEMTGIPSAMDVSSAALPKTSGLLAEAADALMVLGYTRGEVQDALRRFDSTGMNLEKIITTALKYFNN